MEPDADETNISEANAKQGLRGKHVLAILGISVILTTIALGLAYLGWAPFT